MQLLNLDTTTDIKIKNEIKHHRFRDITINNATAKERNIEDLIVAYPGLLNIGEFTLGDYSNNDLLIISRQARTTRRKRADLFAIDQDGNLVVIEVKRDAVDEKNRVEGVEFQAIRYAAASRKMTIEAVIEMFAKYLQSINPTKQQDADQWRSDAKKALCEHLADTDTGMTNSDLLKKIDPRNKQKIYLVAADYEEEVVSACAWLREHKIDIFCFRLRPYQIGTETVLERERLIPPPELDDLMTDSFSTPIFETQSQQTGAVERKASNKPTKMTWTDKEDETQSVTTWKALIETVVRRALDEGLTLEQLQKIMPAVPESDVEAQTDFLAPSVIQEHKVVVNLHGSSATIQDWIKSILKELQTRGKKLGLTIETANGTPLEFP
jgi:hypothetical protein